LLIFLSLGPVLAGKCSGRGPVAVDPGPGYKLGSLTRTYICEPTGNTSILRTEGNSCGLGWCLWRENVTLPGTRMMIRGVVLDEDDCAPVPNAFIEVWQLSWQGRYGSLYPGVENDMCRGRVLARADGSYEYATEISASYGMFRLISPDWWPMTPPFDPEHIHMLAWAPRYNVYSSQYYFDHDPGRFHDPRDIGPVTLHALDPRNMLNLEWNGTFWLSLPMDIILSKNVTSTDFNTTVVNQFCNGPTVTILMVPPGLCFPDRIWLFQLLGPAVTTSLILLIIVAIRAVVGVPWLIVLFIRKLKSGRRLAVALPKEPSSSAVGILRSGDPQIDVELVEDEDKVQPARVNGPVKLDSDDE